MVVGSSIKGDSRIVHVCISFDWTLWASEFASMKFHGLRAVYSEALSANRTQQEHHRRNAHPNYEKPRMQCDNFILKHFAGRVTYGIAGFLEKNNDSLQVTVGE